MMRMLVYLSPLAIAAGLLFSGYDYIYIEITTRQYERVRELCRESPEVLRLTKKLMADGYITTREYVCIVNAVEQYRKTLLRDEIQEIREADEIREHQQQEREEKLR